MRYVTSSTVTAGEVAQKFKAVAKINAQESCAGKGATAAYVATDGLTITGIKLTALDAL